MQRGGLGGRAEGLYSKCLSAQEYQTSRAAQQGGHIIDIIDQASL